MSFAGKNSKCKAVMDDSSPSGSTISTRAMQQIVDKLRHQQYRDSTKATYYCVWKTFNEFFIRLDFKPRTWEERLILFVGSLVQNGKQSSTVKSYISTIKAVLREDDVVIDDNLLLLSALTKACRLRNDRVRTRFPIRKGLLLLLLSKIPDAYDSPQPYLVTLYTALFTSMYFGLFRIGELIKSNHVVKVNDVQLW